MITDGAKGQDGIVQDELKKRWLIFTNDSVRLPKNEIVVLVIDDGCEYRIG